MKLNTPLNAAQRMLVEDAIPLAKWTVKTYITSCEQVAGLGYEDLLQEAYLALCKAAMSYREESGVQFKSYAVTVMRNHLLDHCRKISSETQHLPAFSMDDTGEDADDVLSHQISLASAAFEDDCLSQTWTKEFLRKRREAYRGCSRLGIEALELKVLHGFGVTDIAEFYQVKPNLVGAWISKATAKIRADMTEAERGSLAR